MRVQTTALLIGSGSGTSPNSSSTGAGSPRRPEVKSGTRTAPRKSTKSSAPSMRSREPSHMSAAAKSAKPRSFGISRRMTRGFTAKGATSPVTPKMTVVLVMLEPRALPMPMNALPSSEATRLTRSSGAEVPKPTIVMPMTSVETPRSRAMLAAPVTKRSAAQVSTTRPTTIAAMDWR